MSNREKQRQKRKEKQRLIRKERNQSPWETLAPEPSLCRIFGNPDDTGLILLTLVFAQRDGRKAIIRFEIDVWCMGLRDAYGRANLSDFDVSGAIVSQLPTRTCDVGEARSLITAGIRFATGNRFRLPADWQKFARFAGVTRWQDADLSTFRKNGKLYFNGDLDDLRDAYLGDLEDLLHRDDVDFIAHTKGGNVSRDEMLAWRSANAQMDVVFKEYAIPFVDRIRDHLNSQGKQINDLVPALATKLTAGISLAIGAMGKEWKPESISSTVTKLVDNFVSQHDDRGRAAEAARQFLDTMFALNAKQDWVRSACKVIDDPRMLDLLHNVPKAFVS